MALIAMLLGGAAVNALAFSGSNYLFSMLRSSGVDEERKRHDKAVEQLQAAQAEWSKQRTERLDWINEDLVFIILLQNLMGNGKHRIWGFTRDVGGTI